MNKVFLIVATAFALNFASTQMTVASAQTPVDLTYAAEKSVNSVVFIKVTINSKTQTIEGSDPFEDFFNFGPFSFGDPSSRGQRRIRRHP